MSTDNGQRHPTPFARVPKWIVFAKISPQAVRIYAALMCFADRNDRCFPSLKLLASRLEISVSTVTRGLRELRGIGALRVTHRFSDRGDPTSNLYQLLFDPPGVGASKRRPNNHRATGHGVRAPSGATTDAAQTRPSKNETPHTPKSMKRRCPKHTAAPGASCRDCGTTPKQRRARRQAQVRAILKRLRSKPECPHGEPGGNQRHPETRTALCPLCRRGASQRDDDPNEGEDGLGASP